MPSMSGAEFAKLVYMIETQGSEKAKAAIASVNSAIDQGTSSTKKLTEATEKATQASKLKINALDMLVGRFVLYTQAILYAKMLIDQLSEKFRENVAAAKDAEDGVGKLTDALNAQKDAWEKVKAARGEYVKQDVVTKAYAEATAHEIAAAAIKKHGDALSNLQKWYTQVTGGGPVADPRTPNPTLGETTQSIQGRINATNEVERRLGLLGHTATPAELGGIITSVGGSYGLGDNEMQSIGRYESYKINNPSPAAFKQRDDAMAGGLDRASKLSQKQRDVAALIIAEGLNANLNEKQIVSLLAAAYGESSLGTAGYDTGRTYQGLYQLGEGWGGVKNRQDNVDQVRTMIRAIQGERDPYMRPWDQSTMTPGAIAFALENSDQNAAYYDKYTPLAEGLLAMFTGLPAGQTIYDNKTPAPRVPGAKKPPSWDAGGISLFKIQQAQQRREMLRQYGADAGLSGFIANLSAGGFGGFGLDDLGGAYRGGMPGQPSYGLSGFGMRYQGAAAGSILAARPMKSQGWNDLVQIYDEVVRDEGYGQPDDGQYANDVTVHYAGARRRKARQRAYRQNAIGAAGAFASGGFGGAASFGLDLLAPGLGSIGLPLLGKLGGFLGIGGHKHKDIGTTPSNPLYVRDTLTYNAISQALNILLAQKAQQSSASVTQDFRDVRAQNRPVMRTAMGVAR